MGAGNVIATQGATGSFGLDRDGVLHFAPSLPVQPRSTLGAGDVFHGALIAALALGRSMGEGLQFANVSAALSCRGLDGRSAVPRLAEVEQAMAGLDPGRPSDVEITRLFSA
jgi:sugar/nucleoside kinase (ribokinase family)